MSRKLLALAPAAAAVAGVLTAGSSGAAGANATFVDSVGTKPPPAQVNGAAITRFARDHRKLGGPVTGVNGPTGRLRFSHSVSHYLIRNRRRTRFWRSWSNGYRGDVYFSPGTITVTLPAGTTAFYFYAEPNDPKVFKITASGDGASSGPVKVYGWHGAKFFGFAAQTGSHLGKIVVSSTDRPQKKPFQGGGFALGEFGIHKG